ncbi:MAG: hypothetical protein AAGA42_14545 [Actinomycetota bacterium]
MVATFVRLRLTILANRARTALERPERVALMGVLIAFYAVTRVFAEISTVDWILDAPDAADDGTAVAVSIGLILTASWLAFSVLGGQRATLPLGPMIVLPLTAPQIAVGLFVSGLFGFGLVLTLGLSGLFAAGYYDDLTALLCGALAAIALTAQVMVLGRMVSTLSEVIRRSRRPRLATLGMAVVVAIIGGFTAIASLRALGRGDGGVVWEIAQWLPPSMIARAAPEAAAGDTALAVLLIAAGSVLTVALWMLWVGVIAVRVRMGAPAAAGHHTTDDPFVRFGRRLPGGRLGAIAAREQAMMWRSPAALAGRVIYVGFFGVIFGVMIASAAPDGYAPLAVLALTYPLVIQRSNQIAARARGRWVAVVTPGPRWADVAGYDLAYAPSEGGVIVGAAVIIAGVTDSWEMAAPAALLGITMWLVGQALIHVVAYRLVVPPSWDITADDDASRPSFLQVGITSLALILALLPVIVLIIYGIADDGIVSLWIVVPVSLLYGVALWAATLWWTASWLQRHEADLQAQLRV